jgi:hypothetical protein
MFKYEKEIVTTRTEQVVANIYCDICGSKINKDEKWVRMYLQTSQGDGVSRINYEAFYCKTCARVNISNYQKMTQQNKEVLND